MNLENLSKYVGTLQSYSGLCKILEEDNKTGNSKIKQIKEWQLYMKLNKIKIKYEIVEIYNKPQSAKSKSDFVNALEIAIDMLIKRKDTNIFSYNELINELKLANELYNKAYYNIEKYLYLIVREADDEIDLGEIEGNLTRFMSTSKRIIKQKLDKSIESMNRRGSYRVDIVYKYGKRVGKKIVTRECTDEENRQIEQISNDRLIELFGQDEKKPMVRLYLSAYKTREEYREHINNLTAKKSDYAYTFKCYRFVKLKDISYATQPLFSLNDKIIYTVLHSSRLNEITILGLKKKFIDVFIKI